jgi:hypothetical protein
VVPVTRAVTWAEPPSPKTNVKWFIEMVAGPKWTERLRQTDRYQFDSAKPGPAPDASAPVGPPPLPFPLLDEKEDPKPASSFWSRFKWW